MSVTLGEVVFSAYKPIFKIYLIIGIGFFLARRNILTVSTCRDISDAIVTVIMPCLIFYNIVTYIVSSDIKNVGIIFFEGTLLFATGACLAGVIYVVFKSPREWLGGLISVGLFPNISDLPIAYLQTMSASGNIFTKNEGEKGVAYVCIFLACQVMYQFTFGLFKLIRYDFRDKLKQEEMKAIEATESAGTKSSEDQHASQEGYKIESESHVDVPSPSPSASAQVGTDEEDEDATSLSSSALSRSVTLVSQVNLDNESNTAKRTNSLTSSQRYSLNPSLSRSAALRKMRSQDITDVINEYSEYDNIVADSTALSIHVTSDIGTTEPYGFVANESLPFWARAKAQTKEILRNFIAPNSVSLITSIAIAMAPPLKALFVKSQFHMHSAPDGEPPLSFIMDLTSYIGAASVPLGLCLLGATIARLKVNAIVPGFWKTVVAITAVRMVILPIFGVGLTTGIKKAGWYLDDLVRFVSVLEFCLPNATALVYFTAFYTDPHSEDHLQMDCLALCLIAQYSILFLSLPILISFTIKVSLGL